MITETSTSETNRIAEQLRRSYEGKAWYGPALKELLEGVETDVAARSPAGAHSIWEIVRHLSFWAVIVRQTLEGRPYPPRLTAPADWPEATGSWPGALTELDAEQRALIQAVESFPADRLNERFLDREGMTFYFLLDGLIHHNVYHAGQIALLKK